MRVLFLGNNRVGLHVARLLKEQNEQVVGAVLHPRARRKYGDEILASLDLDPGCVFDGSRLEEGEVRQAISALEPDIGVSALFGYILSPALLDLFPRGCVNLHPGFLPYGRGANPNVWSIIDNVPAGATLHYMDAGIDSGDIIAQRRVRVDPSDTGASLYAKLEDASVDLFAETWPLIRKGNAPRIAQPAGDSPHRTRDTDSIDEIDLDRTYTGRELIDVVRARTFAPHPGAYFVSGGRRVYMRIELLDEDDAAKDHGEKKP